MLVVSWEGESAFPKSATQLWRQVYLNSIRMETLLLDRDKFEEMIRFVIDAMRKGVPEKEVWATLEVMSSKELQSDIESAKGELLKGEVKRFKNMDDASAWLHSS